MSRSKEHEIQMLKDGDLNFDEIVNILDVIVTVNFVIGYIDLNLTVNGLYLFIYCFNLVI